MNTAFLNQPQETNLDLTTAQSSIRLTLLNSAEVDKIQKERGHKSEWIEVNHRRVNANDAATLLEHPNKSDGLIVGDIGGTWQFKPDVPRPDKKKGNK